MNFWCLMKIFSRCIELINAHGMIECTGFHYVERRLVNVRTSSTPHRNVCWTPVTLHFWLSELDQKVHFNIRRLLQDLHNQFSGVAPEGGAEGATALRRGTLAPLSGNNKQFVGELLPMINTFTYCTIYEYLLLIKPRRI